MESVTNALQAAVYWVPLAFEAPFARADVFRVHIRGHLFVEGLLFVVILYLLLQKSYKPPKRSVTDKDEYQRLKLNASLSRVEVNDDELFVQAARVVNNKGLVHGLGNQTQAYYERVGLSTLSSPSIPTAYAPSMYAQIVSRLQKLEEQLNATRKELTRTKEEVQQTKDATARIDLALGARALRFPLLPVPYS